MLRAAWALLLVVLVPPTPAGAQPFSADESGRPYFVQRFSSEEYGLHDQNWAVTQDRHGVVFVANTYGILAYDGEYWEAYAVPNETARSLVADRSGRVYAGLVGDLGYLASDSLGRLGFESLLPHVAEADRKFADVWTTNAVDDTVYFQSFDRLFRWDGARMHVWRTSGRFHKGFAVRGNYYVREEGQGLKQAVGDDLVLVPGGEQFAEERVDVVLPHGEAGLLVSTRSRGFLILEGGRIRPLHTQADTYLGSRRLYDGTALTDGSYALTTTSGSLILMDKGGRVRHVLGSEIGLKPDDLVLYVHEDRQGGLWLALDDGVLRVDAPTALTVFAETEGLVGTVLAALRHDGVLYTATTSGLFRLPRHGFLRDGTAPSTLRRFELVEGDGTQSWAVASVGEELMVARNAGIFVVEEERVRRVSEQKAFVLVASESYPGRVYAGLKEGVEVLERQQGEWVSLGLLPGVPTEVRSLVEGPDGALWIGTLYDGVMRVEMAEGSVSRVEHLGEDEGLGGGTVVVLELHGAPAFLTRHGVYLPTDAAAGSRFEPAEALNRAIGFDGVTHVYLFADETDRVWVARGRRIEQYELLPSGEYALRTPPVLQMPGLDVRTIFVEPSGVVWIGTDSRLLRYDPRVEKDYAVPFPTLVRRVVAKNDSLLFGGAWDGFVAPEVHHRDNNLRFAFSAPSFNAPEATRYQFWLEGFDEGWSAWTAEAQKEYTNLPEAAYRFHVRARNAQGVVSEAGVFAFRILPPWYRTWWAYGAYVLAAAALVWGYGTIRIRQHAKALERQRWLNQQLETANTRLQEANERLHRADQVKDSVLANTSHELRTPLTSILGFAAVLEEDLEGENREFAGLIKKSGERLLSTVDALLDMASLQADLLDLEPVEFDLAEEVAAVVRRLEPEAAAKGLFLSVMPQSARVPVRLDPHSVERVLSSLVGNAIKFTEHGGVTVLLDASEDEVFLTVKDTGIGISEAARGDLFGAFQQASTGYGRTHEGAGLGLAITHRIVHLLGGDIEVESPAEGGTAFRVRLPRFDPRGDGESSTSGDGALAPIAARVLLVEAEGRPLHRLRLLLQASGNPAVAVGAEEALRLARQGPYDVLILDGHAAGPDGQPLLAALRAVPALATAPALAVTAVHLPGDREQFRALGFDDHLAYPFSNRRLRTALESLLAARPQP